MAQDDEKGTTLGAARVMPNAAQLLDFPDTDLVIRLRNHQPSGNPGGCQDCYGTLLDDAADEIERLRDEIQHLNSVIGEYADACAERN